ncbi:MAG: ATP-NAD kinase family protein [Candidatus Baldrarchaeia archaeon]
MRKINLGFLINPIAGMGGRVGLKGTDGDMYRIAIKKGAKPVAPARALEFLNSLNLRVNLYAAPGPMGEDIVMKTHHKEDLVEIVGSLESKMTTADDTKRISREMMKLGVDLLVFVGGDGTARDIVDAVNQKQLALGVPSGVKMYSAVFAVSPRAAARVVKAFAEGRTNETFAEVLDIDEDAYRRNELKVRLYGYLRIPVLAGLMQASKEPSAESYEEEENKKAIAKRIVEEMEPDTLYILGAGTTIKAIADELGIKKTLLGVDAIFNGKVVGEDLDEKGILRLLEKFQKVKIIVTPIGGQGFIFGRGNQQISPDVIKKVGKENIVVVATKSKIKNLDVLRVDTGDPQVDEMLRGYTKVIVDYHEDLIMKVV